MSPLLLKLLLLLIYLILLSIVFRVCELLVWHNAGFVASELINPMSLGVLKLKNVLDARGINYDHIVEKRVLAQLIEHSGDLQDGELVEVEQDDQLEEDTFFLSREHFYEEVEDKKDSVWVIQVHSHLAFKESLSDETWKSIRKKLTHYGIRTGTFDCFLDEEFCSSKRWLEPSIILAMPQGQTYKDQVRMVHTYKRGSPSHILDWINAQLRSKITTFTSQSGAQEWIEMARNRPNHFPLRVAYFSNADRPPIFFSSVSVKFTGRIKFAFISTNQKNFSFSLPKTSQKIDIKVPSILFATPEGELIYGKHLGEYMTYKKLFFYLKTLSPEVNDAFTWGLIIVNALCVFQFFITQGGILKRFLCLLWTIGKYNLLFLLFCLPFLGMCHLPILDPWNFATKISRKFLLSNVMCFIRSDLLLYSHNTTFLLSMFLTYCCTIGLIKGYRERTVQRESDMAWLRGILQPYYTILFGPPRHMPQAQQPPPPNRTQMEEALQRLSAQLAVPHLWLLQHPPIPAGYISRLPTWMYSSVDEEWPSNYFKSSECSICQDTYHQGVLLCGLPCRHAFHHICIVTWLNRGTHDCPNCRRKAYEPKDNN